MAGKTEQSSASAPGLLGAALLLTVWVVGMGCSPTARYQALSTVFDGVPDPDAPVVVPPEFGAPAAAGGNARGPSGAAPTPGSIHQAYADRRCDGCHGKAQWVPRQEPQPYCLSCHQTLTQGLAWVHGPVAYGACLRCHVPHSSPWKHLVRLEGDKLCTQCHEDLRSAEPGTTHETLGKTACLACHLAHGGESRLMLRKTETAAPVDTSAFPDRAVPDAAAPTATPSPAAPASPRSSETR